ncbi:MAG: pilin [Candidatus Pacebacteria bacterium]|nr:pilin [Candidatus Paceibacterota bacterium]
MRKSLNKILVGVFVVVLLVPAVGLAGLKLQQNYPEISGITSGETISLNDISQAPKNAPSNTVSLIKYIFNLSVVILIGLAALGLIIAGVQYVSSGGNPAAQKAARTRVLKALIGLAILFSANLIFSFVVPDFKIPQLEHIYGVSNVLLISPQGAEELRKQALQATANLNAEGITKEFLDSLADVGKLKYFSSQSVDLTNDFGQLIKRPDFEVSFEDFDPAYIGFYGTGKSNIQVRAFAGKSFLGRNYTYSVEGVLDNNNTSGSLDKSTQEIIESPGDLLLVVYLLPKNKYATNQAYLDITQTPQKEVVPTSEIAHPPLSLMVQGIGAGAYLYGALGPIAVGVEQGQYFGEVAPETNLQYIQGKGGQRYLQFDVPNFAASGFDFDEQANEIEIKNNRDKDKSVQDDLLVFLFQNAYYQGPFRAFFEKKDGKEGRGSVPIATLFTIQEEAKWYKSVDNLQTVQDVFNEKKNVSFLTLENFSIGNTIEDLKNPQNNKIKINGMDQQGRIDGASSARIFHLADFDRANKRYESTCEAVVLCNGEDLRGFCLAFTARGINDGRFMSFFLPMPWFAPIPLPNRFPEYLKDALIASPEQKNTYLAEQKDKDFKDNTDFEDNIKSIGIKGNCVVALYENSVKNFQECLKGTLNSCWDNKTPGEKSMVFSQADMVSGVGEKQTPYLNLKNYQINNCLSHWGALGLSKRHSCASAIAVYPVK